MDNVVRRLDFCIEDNEDPPEPRQNTEVSVEM